MKTYIIGNRLGEYVLAISNGIVIKTTKRFEAKKYFDPNQANIDLRKANAKKREFELKEY